MEFCDECHEGKTALCPECGEVFICGVCEDECLGCYLSPPEADDADAFDDPAER